MNYLKIQNVVLKCFSGLLILVVISCDSNTIEIVNNGKSNYEIVVSSNASKSDVKSAEELQNYINKISKVSLEIVDENSQDTKKHKIYIGNLRDEKIKENKISINSENENIFIFGGSEAATQNAVYVFLENYLGCKWYSPTVENVPQKATLVLEKPIAYTYEPEITTRTVHSKLFYNNPVFANKHKVTDVSFPYYVPSARVHTFHKFIPEELFLKNHPEYFCFKRK